MNDCKTCQYATILYRQEKDDRFSSAFTPVGYVRCSGPRYKGRTFFCKDSREACREYQKKERRPS